MPIKKKTSPSPPLTLPPVLSVEEVGALISLTRQSVLRLERQGLLPRVRKLSPHRLVFIKSEIEDWLEKRMEAGAIHD